MNNTSGKYPDVTGYVSQVERVALQSCVLSVAGVEGHALEIGSLNGLSALLTLSVLPSDKTLICVEKGQCETLFLNLMKYGHAGQADIRNQNFNDVVLKPETKLCFAFIDHDHTFENNVSAFEKFWPVLSHGGIVAFHDYGHPEFASGTNAIDKLASMYGLTMYLQAGSFISFKK